MNCARARLELPLLGTGELDPRLEAALWLHLDACAGCRAFAGEERALDDLLARWPTVGARRDISREVLAAAGEAARAGAAPRALSLRRAVGPLLAAAAVLAAFALLPFLRPAPSAGERGEVTTASVEVETDSVPIGSDLTGLTIAARDPFRR
ncbi:MAG TPA: hypothetical protein VFI25_12880 [Planctomycetota bacterium]|jgi:hypothetical protein|nr:hypothetical protein [Planctomycetota bacterium]